MNIDELIAAATDLNVSWGLVDPPINLSMPEESLVSALRELGDMAELTDELQVSTWGTLLSLNALLPTIAAGVKEKHPELASVDPIIEVPPEPVEPTSVVEDIGTILLRRVEVGTGEVPDISEKKVKKDRKPKTEKEIEAETPSQSLPTEVLAALAAGVTFQSHLKPSKRAGNSKSISRKYTQLVDILITEGKYKQNEIVNIVMGQCPGVKESTIKTFVADQKNIKYTAYEKVAHVRKEDGIMCWKEGAV